MSILRDLITEAMEIKAKRHEEQQRELEEEDENSVCENLCIPYLYMPLSANTKLCMLSVSAMTKKVACTWISLLVFFP